MGLLKGPKSWSRKEEKVEKFIVEEKSKQKTTSIFKLPSNISKTLEIRIIYNKVEFTLKAQFRIVKKEASGGRS